MKQSRQEIELAIKKQVKDKMPLVLVERLADGRVINIKYAEHLEVEEVKELMKQAQFNRNEIEAKEKAAKEAKDKADKEAKEKHKNDMKRLFDRLCVIHAYHDYSLDVIKGHCSDENADKIDAWYDDFISGITDIVYEDDILKRYVEAYRGIII